MTKSDIISEITANTGVSKKEVTAVVESFMEAVKDSLIERKENVYLRGFGSFIIKHRAAKTARNITKNTTIMIEAHDLPSFKPAKSFVMQMKNND
ncbi:MAG: integration host factor subunit beta [Prevotella sp.]|nr:integration host factor subunit beta [Prevotella sp.]MDY4039956.1 HU family DNA-binding protein [Prevotella sp.]